MSPVIAVPDSPEAAAIAAIADLDRPVLLVRDRRIVAMSKGALELFRVTKTPEKYIGLDINEIVPRRDRPKSCPEVGKETEVLIEDGDGNEKRVRALVVPIGDGNSVQIWLEAGSGLFRIPIPDAKGLETATGWVEKAGKFAEALGKAWGAIATTIGAIAISVGLLFGLKPPENPVERVPAIALGGEWAKLKTPAGLLPMLDKLRDGLPNAESLRVFWFYYAVDPRTGELYAVLPPDAESSPYGRMRVGYYPVNSPAMLARFDANRQNADLGLSVPGACYLLDTADFPSNDPLVQRMRTRFASKSYSCGIALPANKSPEPHLGAIVVETPNRDADTLKIAEALGVTAGELAKLLSR